MRGGDKLVSIASLIALLPLVQVSLSCGRIAERFNRCLVLQEKTYDLVLHLSRMNPSLPPNGNIVGSELPLDESSVQLKNLAVPNLERNKRRKNTI